MRILVTGGCGFIGSNFIKCALKKSKDVEIVNVDKLGYGSNLANLKNFEESVRYRFVNGDINDYKLILKLTRDVKAIFNFAAETHVDRSISNPDSFFNSNTLGTFTLLEASRKNDVDKIVQVSTDEVYGSAPDEASFNENSALNPSSPYSASKAAADAFVNAYYVTYGLKTFITRCTNNFGQHQMPEKFIPKSIIRVLLGQSIAMYGSGKQVRDWIYVLDHCAALLGVLKRGKPGEIYNISSGNELQNVDVATRILKVLGKPEDSIVHTEDRPGHDTRYSLDSTKIRSKLAWSPKYSFNEGLTNTVEWYIKNDWWWKPLIQESILNPTPWKLRW